MKLFFSTLILILAFVCDTGAEGSLVCGAYIQQNLQYAAGIKQYEDICGVKNSIYLVNVRDEYPRNDVLECYANGKIPMLLVSDSMGVGKIPALARDAGEYNLPLYLCISGDLSFYNYCVDIFRSRAPKTKFVQAVPLSQPDYAFAGVDKADYLAVNATIGADNNNYAFLYNTIKYADVPVIINLAVSHYDTETHTYYTYEKMKTLDYIYNMKKDFGDKLFGINYVNVDYKGQRFDVYSDEKIRTMYSGLVCRFGNSGFGLDDA